MLILFTSCSTVPCGCLAIKTATFSLLSSPSVKQILVAWNGRGMVVGFWFCFVGFGWLVGFVVFFFPLLFILVSWQRSAGYCQCQTWLTLKRGDKLRNLHRAVVTQQPEEQWQSAGWLWYQWALWHRKNLRAECSHIAEIVRSLLSRGSR